ncbi:MAG: hypothetical protein JWN48_451 [Myxococcaceae bacterium]|nr:hypothetical protein [Myxococcaceae bacterium]
MEYIKSLLASMQGAPIAIEHRNTFRAATVALGQAAVTPFDAATPDRAFELDIVPVVGAYVVCMQRTLGGEAADASLPIRWGRTNNLGWILEPEEGRLYDDVPAARRMPSQSFFGEPVGDELPVPDKEQMLLVMGESYDVYWSFDRERFDEVADELKKDPSATPRGLPCQRFVFQPRFPYPLEGLDLLDEELRKRVSHFLVRNEDRGFVVGRQYGQEICIFDVTPEPLRALYLCEFLQFWSIKATMASAQNLATLVRVRNLAEAAHHGSPDIQMEGHFAAKPGSPEREVLDHYRDYVWQCAANGVGRVPLARSLEVTQKNSKDHVARWHVEADSIGRQTEGRAVHPTFRVLPRSHLVLDGPTQDLLLEYFEFYRFGARLKRRDVAERVTTAIEELDSASEASQSLITQLLSAHSSHAEFVNALQWGTPAESALRIELLRRHLTACASVAFNWWKVLESYTANDWKAFSDRLKWMTALKSGFGDAFKNFFDHQLKAYRLAEDSANKALTTFYRYHAASVGKLQAPIFEEQLPTLKTKVRVNFRANTITVLGAYDGTTRLDSPIEFVFTTLEQTVDPAGLKPPPGNMTRARKRRFDLAKSSGQVVEYDVELPVDIKRARERGAQLPASLALASGALNTFFGTIGAFEQLKQGVKLERTNVEAWYELGKNTLGLVDSLASLQDAMAPKVEGYSPLLQRLSPAITKATRTVAVIDAGYNLATGLELLFSDDGAVAYELRQGRSVRALSLRVKGVLQLASAAASGAMGAGLLTVFGGATATGFLAAAAGPVGLGVAVGGVLIACLDGTLDLTKEFGAQVSALEAELDKAQLQELPESKKSALATRRLRRVQELAQATRWS